MEQPITADAIRIDETSAPFCGRWQKLVSTTNWEKGRIIFEWRQAMQEAGAAAADYSDEAWGSRVGGVTGQHVGRLRRVFERFREVWPSYAGLYWSHFQAALDWTDAEMWLEGAVQNAWSISQMRERRWETLGAPADKKPRDEDVISLEIDEDAAPLEDSVGRVAAVQSLEDGQESKDVDEAAYGAADEAADKYLGPEQPDVFHDEPATPFRPFEHLPSLPDDFTEAFEAFKLAIPRHKLAGWSEVARDDVLLALDALKALAVAPSDA